MTNNNDALVAIYKSHTEAAAAVIELRRSKFDMKKLSVVGRDFHTNANKAGYYNAGDRLKYWGKLGAFWGGISGSLFGSASFLVPSIGPLQVAGPLVSWIAGGLEGAVSTGGLSTLGAGLYSLGIPKNSIAQYETALQNGNYILIAYGPPADTAQAKQTISGTNTETLDEYQSSGATADSCLDLRSIRC